MGLFDCGVSCWLLEEAWAFVDGCSTCVEMDIAMPWDSVAGSSAVEVLAFAETNSLLDFEECDGHSSSVPPVSTASSS